MPPKNQFPSYDSIETQNESLLTQEEEEEETPPTTTNEYVLNVAFFSFIGFVVFQSIFALIAHSQAMLADSQAMAVDALTYLFNLLAERIKNRPITEHELTLPTPVRSYRRELQRLYLEVIPPALSVITLIVVTIMTLQEACGTLWGDDNEDEEDENVSVTIMLLFSAGNLLLDIVNVTCFAKAQSAFGLDVVQKDQPSVRDSIIESTRLIAALGDDDDDEEEEGNGVCERTTGLVNLNMCSAWTVSCNDGVG